MTSEVENEEGDMAALAALDYASEVKEEDITRYTDDAGNTIEYIAHNGLQQPLYEVQTGAIPDFRENIKRIQVMQSRESDVYICAFPKAGTHWVWEITRMLTKGEASYEKLSKETLTTEFHLPSEFDNIPSPRTFNSHLPFRCLPKDLKEKKCKIIFVQRNPKDVAVSFYNHTKNFDFKFYNGDWDHYLDLFLTERNVYQGWFSYTKEWGQTIDDNPDLPVLSLYFEDMKQDPINQIRRIGKFLEVPFDDKFVMQIAEKCNFKNMKKANSEMQYNFNNFEMDVSLMFRKGLTGDWKKWFTVAQNERFDAIYEERMKNTKFKYQFC